ncbi:hypothetical protein MBAV_003402, partial [Candidatus Magnetobacterium bavaricum]
MSDETLQEHFKGFSSWKKGQAKPTLRQLEALAAKTLTPLGYFFLPEPPEDKLPITDFRTVGDGLIRRPSVKVDTILKELKELA